MGPFIRLETTDASLVLGVVGSFTSLTGMTLNTTEHPIFDTSYTGVYHCRTADSTSVQLYHLDIIGPISRSQSSPTSLQLNNSNATYKIPCISNGSHSLNGSWTSTLPLHFHLSSTTYIINMENMFKSVFSFQGDDPNIAANRNDPSSFYFNVTCTTWYTRSFDCNGTGSSPPRPQSVVDRCTKATQPLSTTTTINVPATHCAPLDTLISDVFITPSTPNTKGTRVMVPCDQIYCPRNVKHQFTCLPNGFWTIRAQFTHCEKINSTTIQAIPRSTIGTSVTAACRDGHASINGPETVQCLTEGIWSTLPTCSATHCEAIEGSTISDIDGIAIGESVTVKCRSGYDNMVGSSTIQCMADGNWSSIPSCFDINECLMEETLCSDNCTNLTPGFMCTCSNGTVGCFGQKMAQTIIPSSSITTEMLIGMLVASLVLGALITALFARIVHIRCTNKIDSNKSNDNLQGSSPAMPNKVFTDEQAAETAMTSSDAYGVAVSTDEHNYDYVRP
ncbi:uncharacterized protein LOC135825082 [Sycon ciliatum]|uniref:uncharacterized protein LOC135825082 n=1 Tax=Sycon ciliatum TaxID=27933 RepID=UPI0031F6BAA0